MLQNEKRENYQKLEALRQERDQCQKEMIESEAQIEKLRREVDFIERKVLGSVDNTLSPLPKKVNKEVNKEKEMKLSNLQVQVEHLKDRSSELQSKISETRDKIKKTSALLERITEKPTGE